MLAKKVPLFRLFGFQVYVDWSWLIIAFLMTWSLAMNLFPSFQSGLSAPAYWILGILGTLGLFFSIIFHELSHSLVSRKSGTSVKSITLFIFGGVAEMEDEPTSPRHEFLMAVAGPASSVLLGGILYALYYAFSRTGGPREVAMILRYLWTINFVLAGFNLIPAYPLDGGRILRSVLWKIKGDLRWSTRIASRLGSAFGFILMVVGVINLFRGVIFGGMWWILIGLFVRNASIMSYRRLLMQQLLGGEPISKFMQSDVKAVSPDISLEELVVDHMYLYHFKMYPVVENDTVIGCISTRDLKDVPREDWSRHTVKDRMQPCNQDNTIDPDADAMEALTVMNRSGNSRLLAVKDGHIVGIIALKDLLSFFSLKLELEGEEAAYHIEGKN